MPLSLSRAFTETHSFTSSRINEYADGASQRTALLSIGRRSWQFSKHLSPAIMDLLRSFWIAQGTAPFYFYNPKETSPAFSYDATGAAAAGRYRVRFSTAWNQNLGIGMLDVNVELVQVFRRIGGLTSNVAMIVDTGAIVGSGYNLSDQVIPGIMAAAEFFLASVEPLTGGGIAVFSNYYQLSQRCGVSQDQTVVWNAINSMFRTIGSSTFQALLAAVALGISYIVMFSQGYSTDGTGTYANVVSALTGSGIKVVVFPIGDPTAGGTLPCPNLGFLNGLVAISGGTVYPDYSNASITQAVGDYFTVVGE